VTQGTWRNGERIDAGTKPADPGGKIEPPKELSNGGASPASPEAQAANPEVTLQHQEQHIS